MVTSAVIVILIAGIGLLIEICQFYYSRKTFIRDLTLLLQVSLCILSIIFVSVFWTPCMCPQKWQWQIGVIAVLFAWTNLIELCAKFPSIGIYIIMFGKIVRTFLEVIIFSVLLLSTFAITLYMTFSVTNFQVSNICKRNPPITFVCVSPADPSQSFFFNMVWIKWRFFIGRLKNVIEAKKKKNIAN